MEIVSMPKRQPQPKSPPPFGDRTFIARVPDTQSDYKADVYRIDWRAVEIEYLIDGRIIDRDAIEFPTPDAWARAGYATQERIYAWFRRRKNSSEIGQ
jgi:hypothetical protein